MLSEYRAVLYRSLLSTIKNEIKSINHSIVADLTENMWTT